MKHWLVPEDFDHSWAEAHHLLSTVDADQDQKLSQVVRHFELEKTTFYPVLL